MCKLMQPQLQNKGPSNILHHVVKSVVRVRPGYRYSLPHIGQAIEKLMGNGYRASYNTDEFRLKYAKYQTFRSVCTCIDSP
jgi:hypothetical protein